MELSKKLQNATFSDRKMKKESKQCLKERVYCNFRKVYRKKIKPATNSHFDLAGI
jgi:hypothetical protein